MALIKLKIEHSNYGNLVSDKGISSSMEGEFCWGLSFHISIHLGCNSPAYPGGWG